MKKFINIALIIMVFLSLSGCKKAESTIQRAEDGPMTYDEILMFAQRYGTQNFGEEEMRYRLLVCTDSYSTPFSSFLKSIPKLESDICHPATEDEQPIIDSFGGSKNNNYYWADAKDVQKRWYEYVDKSSDIPMKIANNDSSFYSESEDRYYFIDNTYSDSFEIKDGYIQGEAALLYTEWVRIYLKYSDNDWKLVSFTDYAPSAASICQRMERLTGSQLWDINLKLSRSDELFDGYRDGDNYILYSKYEMFFVKYENNEYKIIHKSGLDKQREKNVYEDEGYITHLQFTVNYNSIPTDDSKGKAYNDAITAYNELLAREAEGQLEYTNENNENISTIPAYVKDLNDDGIPELLMGESPLYPYTVYRFENGALTRLLGATSNNQHGGCYLLENGMYASKHFTTGWFTSFVTYNKDGSQTLERFSEYDKYGYYRLTVNSKKEYSEQSYDEKDVYSIEFEKDDQGKKKFYEMYAPYEQALEHPFVFDKVYSPFVLDETANYSPYCKERIKRYNS